MIFSNDSINTNTFKIFDLSGFREIVILRDLYLRIGDDNQIFTKKIFISFLNNDNNFYWVSGLINEFAERLFEIDLLEGFISSELFKKNYLINNFIKQDAEELLYIKSRLNKDMNFKYPLEKLLGKMDSFKEKAKELGFTADETDMILSYPEYKPKDHFFLWYYQSYASYMWTWIIANIIFIIIISLWIVFLEKKFFNLIGTLFNKKLNNVLPRMGGFFLLGFINYEIFFDHAPEYLSMKYYILPTISFLISCVLLIFLKRDNKDKKIHAKEKSQPKLTVNQD